MVKKFRVRDRVQRLIDIHDPTSLLKYGMIILSYDDRIHDELYGVKWDDGKEQFGYLHNTLEPEVKLPTIVLTPEIAERWLQAVKDNMKKPKRTYATGHPLHDTGATDE